MKDLARLLDLLESTDLQAPPSGLGAALTGPLAPLDGALLGERYRVRSLLGVGGMGKVLLAEDEAVGRLVTLKLLRDVETPAARERLRREAIAAARINHPNVVRVHELVETAGQLFVVAEYVEDARDLEQAWRGRARAARLELLLQVADGLAAAHAAGVVHRDVKPENILVDATNRARVGDFGIAFCRDLDRLTRSGVVMGSPATMAPEQARGRGVDPHVDVWSLGVLLYLALYDALPFEGQSLTALLNRVAQDEPDYPREFDVPAGLRRVCQRALSKDPARRYADAGAFAAALRAGLEAKAPPVLPLAGLLVLALALAWLWLPAPSVQAPPSPLADSGTSPPASPSAPLPLRVRLGEPPLRLALGDDLLCAETSQGVTLWGVEAGERRGLLQAQRLGQESSPHAVVAPKTPRTLRVEDGQGDATLAQGRLELRGPSGARQLPLPEGLPETFQELALTPTSLVLVCGARSNGSRILVWSRPHGKPLPLLGSDESYLTPRALALSPSGARLAVGGQAGLVVVFQLDRPRQVPVVLRDPQLNEFTPRAHRLGRSIEALSFPREGQLLSSDGASLALWSLPAGTLLQRAQVRCHSLASRGGRVAFGGREEVLLQAWGGSLPRSLR